MPAARGAAPERIREANALYHDAAAADYDSKWGIDFGPLGQDQVREKMSRALGGWPVGNGTPTSTPFRRALEIGAGTGYFGLNLLQLELVEHLTASDISEGMLDELAASAARLDLDVETVRSNAEQLPFDDESFDLVFGHAVLHHLPDLARAANELRRVLRPGGTIAFCGEPSRYGDTLAALPKRSAAAIAPAWRRLVGARPRRDDPSAAGDGHELESEVDVHAFGPGQLHAIFADAGFTEVRIQGEELLASLYGWWLRSLESTADPDRVPWSWRSFAFRSYIALQRVDRALLEPRLPPALFYNLVLSGRKPG
jgi:SAM-dependent methyltransferase